MRWMLAAIAAPVLLLAGWAATTRRPLPPTNSVAVLPWRVIGDTALFAAANGLAEELTNALVNVGGISVRSTAHARDAVASGGDIDRIGRKLGVAYVVDGAAQAGSGASRLTLRVIRAQDATAVWAGTFDFDRRTVVETAHHIATEIRAVLGDSLRQP